MQPKVKEKIDALIQRSKINPTDFNGRVVAQARPDSLNKVIRNKKEAEDFMRALDAISSSNK